MATNIADVLAIWRELEHQLDGLSADDERAHDIRARIELMRGRYQQMAKTAAESCAALQGTDDVLGESRLQLRKLDERDERPTSLTP
jgi:hypothetical protein